MHEQSIVGAECTRQGITDQLLHDILNFKHGSISGDAVHSIQKTPVLVLTNKIVIELSEARDQMGKSWPDLLPWLQTLSSMHDIGTAKSVHIAVERLFEHKRELVLAKKTEECEEFLSREFSMPRKQSKENVQAHCSPEVEYEKSREQHAKEIEALVSQMEQSNKEIEMLSQIVRDQSAVGMTNSNEIQNIRDNLTHMQKKHEETSKKLQDAMEKLSMYSARNFNKKLKRRDATNEKLKEMTALQKAEFEQKEG